MNIKQRALMGGDRIRRLKFRAETSSLYIVPRLPYPVFYERIACACTVGVSFGTCSTELVGLNAIIMYLHFVSMYVSATADY